MDISSTPKKHHFLTVPICIPAIRYTLSVCVLISSLQLISSNLVWMDRSIQASKLDIKHNWSIIPRLCFGSPNFLPNPACQLKLINSSELLHYLPVEGWSLPASKLVKTKFSSRSKKKKEKRFFEQEILKSWCNPSILPSSSSSSSSSLQLYEDFIQFFFFLCLNL